MILGLNWVDLVIILTLLSFAIEAFGKPLIGEILDLLSFIAAFFLALRLYNLAAKYIESQFHIAHGFSQAIGFLAVWFTVETMIYIIAAIVSLKLPKIKTPSGPWLSMIPAVLRGLIFTAIVLVFIGTFPINPELKKAVQDSEIGSLILKNSYQLEQPIQTVFGGVAKDTLSFLTIEPKTNESVNLGFQTSNFNINNTEETQMVDLVNKERVSRGLQVLTFDPALREIARVHSADMFERGYFSHYSPERETVADRAQKAGIDYQLIGENLAYAPTLQLAHQGLMNSPGHRANILSPDYHKIGIGVMDGSVYGKMFTQVFKD